MNAFSSICLPATDHFGRSVSIPLSDIRALAPDEERHGATVLFLEDSTAQVDEDYDTLIDRIATYWPH